MDRQRCHAQKPGHTAVCFYGLRRLDQQDANRRLGWSGRTLEKRSTESTDSVGRELEQNAALLLFFWLLLLQRAHESQ